MMPAPATTGYHIRMEAVRKSYGRAVALHGIDLELGAGRFVVLLGPSGSGKSTLARCLAGVERIDSGRLHLGGQLVGDGRRHLPPERRNLAMVFQDYALWPHLRVRGNVAYALRRHHLDSTESRRRVDEALEQVGLASLSDRYPHELSGGEQQRVALARAVVARPGLLIFDEPLSNLDADLRERLRVEIATLTRQSGATAVYITHDQSEAFALADEIAVLDSGSLVQFGPPEEIYHRPATPFVARFTGISGELPGRVRQVGRDDLTVDVAGSVLRCRAGDRVAIGQPVRVLVRPAATAILDVDGSGPDRSVQMSGAGTLRGQVVDVAYRGRGYDHVVECESGTLSAVFAPNRHERGNIVRLTVAAQGCVAYRETGPHPAHNDEASADMSYPADLTAVILTG